MRLGVSPRSTRRGCASAVTTDIDIIPRRNEIVAQKSIPVLIIGAGFAGLNLAKQLGRRGIAATVVDRRNYHLFQPLLYQVATAALSPADIAEPIRKLLRAYPSISVVMSEVIEISRGEKMVTLADGQPLHYERLVVATGATHSYFGQDHWREVAPGLKCVEDATAIRAKILSAFERAEVVLEEEERRSLLTFAVIGGGPTGVELAGSIAEIARLALTRDFRRIDPSTARILLIEGGPRLLAAFDPALSEHAHNRLERLGVEVLLSRRVVDIVDEGLVAGDTMYRSSTILWAAGVAASPVGQLLGAELDRAGRVKVTKSLSLPDDPSIFVLGDLAHVADQDGNPLPGLAQVAKQQGLWLGRQLRDNIEAGRPLPAFQYRSRGNAAIIGRHAAVYDGTIKLRGTVAWLIWAFVHIYLLVGFQNRIMVSIQWLWRYLTAERGVRLIIDGLPPPHERLTDRSGGLRNTTVTAPNLLSTSPGNPDWNPQKDRSQGAKDSG
jgi:NADH:ubiquinone reductase (H+-translocating)